MTRRNTIVGTCRLWLAVLWILMSPGGEVLQARSTNTPAPRLLIQPRSAAEVKGLQQSIAERGHRLHKELKNSGHLQVVELPDGKDLASELKKYRADKRVEYAEPDFWVQATLLSNDPYLTNGLLWALNSTGSVAGASSRIEAPLAWNQGRAASNVIVAVIDSGIRTTHEDLAANLWTNRAELRNGIDDDGNGVVDDLHGFNAIAGNGDLTDNYGHGTHVAGTIGARGNNGTGVVGICWEVQLMACKFMDSSGRGPLSDAIECIDYAIAKGAHVINASWGGTNYSLMLERAIQRAHDAGIIFVTAAGNEARDNDRFPSYPGNYQVDNVVSVAASTSTDLLDHSYSNYGRTNVDLCAPGTLIYSTAHTGNSDYRYGSGTSMAGAQVSGAFALLRQRFPGVSHLELIQRLLNATDRLPAYAGSSLSQGRLNLAAALLGRWTVSTQAVAGGTIQVSPWQSNYYGGTTLQLAAIPDTGFQFAGWTGSLSGTNANLSLAIQSNLVIGARFTQPEFRLASTQLSSSGLQFILPDGITLGGQLPGFSVVIEGSADLAVWYPVVPLKVTTVSGGTQVTLAIDGVYQFYRLRRF